MPTGYTHAVQTGEITEFPDFAMQCARAFGALIMMRDEPSGAEIPEAFEPSTYSAERATEARAKLAALQAMTDPEIKAAADADYRGRLDSWEQRKRKRAEGKARYEAMLAKVTAWTPPTPDHVEMKSFMLDQLKESIKFDCSGDYDVKPEPVSIYEWRIAEINRLTKDIAYHEKAQAEEVARTEGRNLWLRALRDSLKGSRHD